MSRIDYSKWDHLVDSDDDDDEAASGELPHRTPAVYRVGEGETLTLPGRNVTLTSTAGKGLDQHQHHQQQQEEASAAAAATAAGGDRPTPLLPVAAGDAAARKKPRKDATPLGPTVREYLQQDRQRSQASPAAEKVPAASTGAAVSAAVSAAVPVAGSAMEEDEACTAARPAARPGAAEALACYTRNGGETPAYFWSQSKDSVTVRVKAPAGTRAKMLQVELSPTGLAVRWRPDSALPAHAGALLPPPSTDAAAAATGAAAAAAQAQAAVAAGGHDTLLAGELFGRVEVPDDPLDMDWEVCDNDADPSGLSRVVCIELPKTALAGGQLVMWWKSLIKGHPEIDTDAIPDRRLAAAQTQRTADAFAKAHDMFREKMRNRPPRIEVEVPPEQQAGAAEAAEVAAAAAAAAADMDETL